MKVQFDSIEDVVTDLGQGRLVIVVDDADRENEGDLILAAEKATQATINFMARFGRGLICVPASGERLRQLGIEEMVAQNRESFKTDFQVSVDAARGIHRHQRRRSRANDPGDGQPDGGAGGSGAARAYLSVAC